MPTKNEAAIKLADASVVLEDEWVELSERIEGGDTKVRDSWVDAKKSFFLAVANYRNASLTKVVEALVWEFDGANELKLVLDQPEREKLEEMVDSNPNVRITSAASNDEEKS